MKKLLVVLLALATVAAFGAVNFSGNIRVWPAFTYDASENSFSMAFNTRVRLFVSASNEQGSTGFSVTLGNEDDAYQTIQALNANWTEDWGLCPDTYVWQKLYDSENFDMKVRLGYLDRSLFRRGATRTGYISTPYFWTGHTTNAVAFDFDIAAGDLSDGMSLYVYAPNATSVNADFYNKLSFNFVTVELLLMNIISPDLSSLNGGLAFTVDAAKALNIQGASLSLIGGLALSGVSGDLSSLLSSYYVGANLGYDKIKASFGFADGKKLGFGVSTTALSPVTITGDVYWGDLTDMMAMTLGATVSWKTDLLSHTVYLTYSSATLKASLGWAISASF